MSKWWKNLGVKYLSVTVSVVHVFSLCCFHRILQDLCKVFSVFFSTTCLMWFDLCSGLICVCLLSFVSLVLLVFLNIMLFYKLWMLEYTAQTLTSWHNLRSQERWRLFKVKISYRRFSECCLWGTFVLQQTSTDADRMGPASGISAALPWERAGEMERDHQVVSAFVRRGEICD